MAERTHTDGQEEMQQQHQQHSSSAGRGGHDVVLHTESRGSLVLHNNFILDLIQNDDDKSNEEDNSVVEQPDDDSVGPRLADEDDDISVSAAEGVEVKRQQAGSEKEHNAASFVKLGEKASRSASRGQSSLKKPDKHATEPKIRLVTTATSEKRPEDGESPSSSAAPPPPLLRQEVNPPRSVGSTRSSSKSSTDPATPSPGAYVHVPGTNPTLLTSAELSGPVDLEEEGEGINPTNHNDAEVLISAVAVVDDDHDESTTDTTAIENKVRQRILQQAVQADSVEVLERKARRKWMVWIAIATVLVVVVVGLTVGLIIGLRDDEQPSTSPTIFVPTGPTLELVKARDRVICGAYFPADGLTAIDENGRMQGLLADVCRAISAVALDDPEKVEFVVVGPWSRFEVLENRTVDVITEPATHTMERDVRERSTGAGLSFSAPFYYSGVGFAGVEQFVECMDDFDANTGICREVKVCVTSGTTHKDVLLENVPAANAIERPSGDECIEALIQNECNVVAGEPITLNQKRFRDLGYEKPVNFTRNVLSREPLALVTRDVDTEWSDIVNSVMDILFAAEGHNITQQSIRAGEPLPGAFRELGSQLVLDRTIKVVAAVGNYGEIYSRTLEPFLPRGAPRLNELNSIDDGTGLLYSFPFGFNLEELDLSIQAGEKIDALRARGSLRCGVFERSGFAELNETSQTWTGFDVEFCKALAAALFRTEEGTLEILSFGAPAESSFAFESLLDGSVDVVAGQRMSLTNKYEEPSTGVSYSFSPPYFYGEDADDVIGLATTRNDTKWSDLVYWVVMGVIYAEEQSITTSNSTEMPIVNVYGDDLKQMFWDCISRVGNYGNMYARTLEDQVPRSGRNSLNDPADDDGLGPQQIALPIA